MYKHEIEARMKSYKLQCDAGHKEFDLKKYVEMQIALADAPKEKWYKRLM